MKYIRINKPKEIDEAWFDSSNSINNDNSSVKQELLDLLQSINKICSIHTESLDYKFYNYIGGQLVESYLRGSLNLQDSQDMLDGIFKSKFGDYYIEVKAFMNNKFSGIRRMFTSKEIEKIRNNENCCIILCSYTVIKGVLPGTRANELTYSFDKFYVLTRKEFLANLKMLNKKRRVAIRKKKEQQKQQN